MIASEIITKARYTLGDTVVNPRWSDIRLLSILDDLLISVANDTTLYQGIIFEPITSKTLYDVSNRIIKIERIEHNFKVLKMLTHTEMDEKYGDQWQIKRGDIPEVIVFDLALAAQFRLYPTIVDTSFISGDSDNTPGIVTGIHLSLETNELEIVNDISEDGGVTNLNIGDVLKIFCIKLPTKAETLETELDEIITKPMIAMFADGVASAAFIDSTQNQNLAVGNALYIKYLQTKQMILNSKFNNSTRKIRETKYNPIN